MAPIRAAVSLARASPRAGLFRRCCRAMSSSSPPPPPPAPPKEIAVLGGGLTGLVTAYYLATRVPRTTRITVYESSPRLGGWIDSSPVFPGEDEANVFEAGARTVAPQRRVARYDDVLLLGLVAELGLADRLRVTRRRAAQYIYYPDHLVEVTPGGGSVGGGGQLGPLADKLWRAWRMGERVLTEPLFAGLVPVLARLALLPEPEARKAAREHSVRAAGRSRGRWPADESVGSYAVRRLGPAAATDAGRAQAEALVNNVLSAMMHGIYGGDVWRLSVGSSPLRADWVRDALEPLCERYALRMQYAELRQHMHSPAAAAAAITGTADGVPSLAPELVDAADTDADAPLERPLPAALVPLARASIFRRARPSAFVATSDLALLDDLVARTQGSQGSPGSPGSPPTAEADLLVRLAMASTQWTTFGFAGGFGTLTNALARRLRQQPNVRLRTGEAVRAVTANAGPTKLAVRTAAGSEQYDRVVSTLAAPALYRITGGDDGDGDGSDAALPALRDAHAVTIMVVNLYYDEPGLNAPYRGFGYLIPQSVPLAENPEMALGVLFDSDREALLEGWEGLDDSGPADEFVSGTKLTVLLGGHFWDDYADADFPAPDEAVAMAEAVVRRHLRYALPAAAARPAAARAKLCRQCIPQHYVGHAERMAAADAQLARAFGGRLAVAGGSFTTTGPGVLASVRSAYDVALSVAGRGYRTPASPDGEVYVQHVGDTGLARFARPELDAFIPVPRNRLPLRFGNKTFRSPVTGTWTVDEEW